MRAAGMQVLTDQIVQRRPGVTIYGIGDEEHQEHTSGHNEDDTPGVKAEDQDSDSAREHRAIDVMVDESTFIHKDGDRLVQDLVTDPANQQRMIYVNWGKRQWHRKNGWQPVDNSADPHGHVHISGEADADENTAPWNLSNWDVEEDFMFVQVTGHDEIYVPRGSGYVHLTSGAALAGALDVGYQIIQVPTLADVEALLGPKWEPVPPPVIGEDRLREILREEIAKTKLA